MERLCIRVTCVLGSISEAPEASFMFCLGNCAPTCLFMWSICSSYGATARTAGTSSSLGTAIPALLANQHLSERSPVDLKSGFILLSAMTFVSASGIWAILVTTAPFLEKTGFSGV